MGWCGIGVSSSPARFLSTSSAFRCAKSGIAFWTLPASLISRSAARKMHNECYHDNFLGDDNDFHEQYESSHIFGDDCF